MTTHPDSPLYFRVRVIYCVFFRHTELFVYLCMCVCVCVLWNWQSCLCVGRAHNYVWNHLVARLQHLHSLRTTCSCNTSSDFPSLLSLRSVAHSVHCVVLVFMTRTLNSNVFFVLVLLLLASFHCTPKLTSSAPNYLRKLRVKSRQPVIYFTSIEVEKNKVKPEGSTQKNSEYWLFRW